MKVIYATVALAVALLGSAGLLFWKDYLGSRNLEINPLQAVSQIKLDFESNHKSFFTFNTQSIREGKASPELVDPAIVLPHTDKYPLKEMKKLFRYAETCKGGDLRFQNPDLQKTYIWHQYTCGKRKTLPEFFFTTAPYMHPSGVSFVKLAAHLQGSPYSEALWQAQHLRYAHVLECVSGKFLSHKTFRSLLNGDPLIETQNHVLMAHKIENSRNPSVTYSTYNLSDWREFLKHQYAVTTENHGIACFLQEGTLCWIKNSKRNGNESFRLAMLFTMGLIVLAGTLLSQIVRKNLAQKKASRQRTFVLQMLTHEIRTPATALQLSLETLRDEFDRLPIKSQEAFLRICDQTQKLGRVIEASKQYLINDNRSGSVKFKTQPVDSVNKFFEAIVEKYGEQVILKGLDIDRSTQLDRYWIELCLNNLIDNALSHGKPPVTVLLSHENGNLIINVQDQGNLKAKSINDLAVPFQKGSTSQGLGLGLVLVQKIAQAMDGELTLSSTPTTNFSISIRDLT